MIRDREAVRIIRTNSIRSESRKKDRRERLSNYDRGDGRDTNQKYILLGGRP